MSGRVISSSSCAVELAAGSTSEVGCTLDAPADLTMIGFRVKASTPFFADGEQAILPVLEAATPVIDSAPFYMGPDTREAVVTLPQPPMPSMQSPLSSFARILYGML